MSAVCPIYEVTMLPAVLPFTCLTHSTLPIALHHRLGVISTNKTDPDHSPLEAGITQAHMFNTFALRLPVASSTQDSLVLTLHFAPPDAGSIEESLYNEENPDCSRLDALEVKVCLLQCNIEHEADWLKKGY